MTRLKTRFGRGLMSIAAVACCSMLSGCIGEAGEESDAPAFAPAADDELPDTVIEKVTLGDEELRVTIALMDDHGGTVIAVVASPEAAVPTALVHAKTAYQAYVVMGGDMAAMPEYIKNTKAESAAEPALEESEQDEQALNVALAGNKAVSYLPVDCSLSGDGVVFNNLWQYLETYYPFHTDHWYYNGSKTYKSTITVVADDVRSHLCNRGVSGSGQVIHRQRGSYGTAWYQYSQEVPKGHRGFIAWLSNGPNYYDYNSYATRRSNYYTAGGNYKLGIVGRPDN